VTPEFKRRAAYYAGVGFLAILSALLSLWAFSKPHTALEYMVGGTLGTTILLAGTFVRLVKMGYLGRRGAPK
jgi:hypothetical protein